MIVIEPYCAAGRAGRGVGAAPVRLAGGRAGVITGVALAALRRSAADIRYVVSHDWPGR